MSDQDDAHSNEDTVSCSDSCESGVTSNDDEDAVCEAQALELQQLCVATLDGAASSSQRDSKGTAKATRRGTVACIAYDAGSQRLFLGLDDGQILHWHISAAVGAGSLQHLGKHAGSVGCIAMLERHAPATALVVTGSADVSGLG